MYNITCSGRVIPVAVINKSYHSILLEDGAKIHHRKCYCTLGLKLYLCRVLKHFYGRRRQGHYIFIFYRCNLCIYFLFRPTSSALTKDQPWDLDKTWPVGRKWCRFTNDLKKFGPFPNLGAKTSNFGSFYRDFRTRYCISLKRNVA